MPALERLFNPGDKARLYPVIARRVSCRHYAAPLSAADWAAVSYIAGRYQLPGARLHLTRVEESLFTGTLLGPGRVTGCQAVAVVVASSAMPRARLHAGLLGEALCLEAACMNLAACWITGTYRKKQLNIPLQPGESILGVIALGHPAEGVLQPGNRRRKPLEKLCKGDVHTWPEDMIRAARAVLMAPSALNLQPWEMSVTPTRFCVDASDRAQLDLGIALCHAELALSRPHAWRFAEARKDPAAWAQLDEHKEENHHGAS